MDRETLDEVIIARLSVDPNEGGDGGETSFEYLAGCWKRLYPANREFGRIVSDFSHSRGIVNCRAASRREEDADNGTGYGFRYTRQTIRRNGRRLGRS